MKTFCFSINHQVTKDDIVKHIFNPKCKEYRLSDGCTAPYAHKMIEQIKNYPTSITKAWLIELEKKGWMHIKTVEQYKHFAKFCIDHINHGVEIFKMEQGIDITKELVLHLRVGDVFRGDIGSRQYDLLNQYITTTDALETILQKLQQKQINRVIVVCGMHRLFGEWGRNITYFKDVHALFNKFKIDYILTTCDPDIDFALMCGAKTFIVSGGGFSALAQNVRKVNGKFEEDEPFFDLVYNPRLHKDYYKVFEEL